MPTWIGVYIYDQLLKNEWNDKYIISVVNLMTKDEIVDVFRVSEIKDPELRSLKFLLDEGYPLIHTCDDGDYVFSYLSEVKVFTESVDRINGRTIKKTSEMRIQIIGTLKKKVIK